MAEKVVVMGASPKPDRYSHKAVVMLAEYGHQVIPVNPYHSEVAGIRCAPSLAAITAPVDTVSVYMRAELLAPQLPELLALAPRRIIFNPGSEGEALMEQLRRAGIVCEEACTLVLLRTQQF
ncbi:CoA-binding protein [Spongiibacter sp.]|uniref:CoA-binding protein n=1 Tax=Spongiibacter sp. TaxID=2024860 RepID=UPI0035657C7A